MINLLVGTIIGIGGLLLVYYFWMLIFIIIVGCCIIYLFYKLGEWVLEILSVIKQQDDPHNYPDDLPL